ncbi:MAG TPA: DUF2911 domain-containing protein [Gemmatimonadaceae bacterium]|nr:DUF2911 domain-containing protein [Gemmatimonadaceae bacterium]
MHDPTARRHRGGRPIPAALLATVTLAALAAPTHSTLGAQGAARPTTPDSAAYVTRLGNDTLAVERFVRTPGRIEAEVLLRTPTTSRTRYVMELDDAGNMTRMEAVTVDPVSGAAAAPARGQTIERRDDSLVVTTTGAEGAGTRVIAAPRGTMPFIDMVHWPYEVALLRDRAGLARKELPLLSGCSVQQFGLEARGADSVVITHPFRGSMVAKVDARGRILGLDAAGTTRKVVVERRPWLDIDAAGRSFVAADAAGKSFGALSGRGAEEATVHGAQITVDFGTPEKRGREIWGALVPYGQVWRTGANLATHFTTDRALAFGDFTLPAGTYTLFSIPAADGGQLIINRQTKQNGNSYDASQDLVRLPLTARALAAPVEVFTIDVAETASGGELRLQWDRTELVAPFVVR